MKSEIDRQIGVTPAGSKEGAEREAETRDLPVSPSARPHLSSRASGNDRNNVIMDKRDGDFLYGMAGFRDRAREIQKGLREEKLLFHFEETLGQTPNNQEGLCTPSGLGMSWDPSGKWQGRRTCELKPEKQLKMDVWRDVPLEISLKSERRIYQRFVTWLI